MDLAEDHIRNAGYGGFSFRDLAAEIGIKSASVHHHFPTKATMAAAVARRYGDRFLASVARRLNETADDAIRAYRAAFREGLQRDGRMCLCGVLGAEAGVLSADVAKEILSFFRRCIDDLSQRIGGPDAERRAFQIMATLEGAVMLARVYRDIEAFDQAAAGLRVPQRRRTQLNVAAPATPRQIRENEMTRNSGLDDEAATELHNRLANQIVAQIVNEPIAAGGTISDVLVGVVLGCFELGSDAKVLDLVVGRVKERLAKARLEDHEPKGNG
jgi:TetR/AcrR family transcriptional repressor of nem operon